MNTWSILNLCLQTTHCLPSKSCILTEALHPAEFSHRSSWCNLQCTQCPDDVLMLQKLSTSCVRDAVLLKYTFSYSWWEQYTMFSTEKIKALKTLQPLIHLKKISNTEAEKTSASGLSLGQLQLAYSRWSFQCLDRKVWHETKSYHWQYNHHKYL